MLTSGREGGKNMLNNVTLIHRGAASEKVVGFPL